MVGRGIPVPAEQAAPVNPPASRAGMIAINQAAMIMRVGLIPLPCPRPAA